MSSMLKPTYIRSRTNSAASIKSTNSNSKSDRKKSNSNLKSDQQQQQQDQNGYAEEKIGSDWKPRPGHPGNLNPDQSNALLLLASHLRKMGAITPNPTSQESEQEEIQLLRFLRARSWSVQPAKEMYLKAQEWKRENNLDQLVGDGEGSWDFKEREDVASSGWRMYFHKTDKLGRPIFVQNLANINTTQVFQKTTPERITNEFAVTLEKAIRYRYRASTEKAGHLVEDNLMILNIEGLGMGTFWSFKNQLQQLLGILDSNYPELSGRVQIINAPWIFATVWGTLKGWLPVGTVEKIDIAGSDYSSILLEFVEKENLPLIMGGSCTCPHSSGGCETSDEGPWLDFIAKEKKQAQELEKERRKQLEIKTLAPSHSKPELVVHSPTSPTVGNGSQSQIVNGVENNGKGEKEEEEHGREFLEKDPKRDSQVVEEKLNSLEV